jgi:hypothetical protein
MNEQQDGLSDEYWTADRAAFEAAMTEGGEVLDYTKWGLPGIENAYKNDRTRLMYFAWTEGRAHDRAILSASSRTVDCEAGHAPRGKCEFGPYGWRGVIVCKHCKQAPPAGVLGTANDQGKQR